MKLLKNRLLLLCSLLYIIVLYASKYFTVRQKLIIVISTSACFLVALLIFIVKSRKVFSLICIFTSFLLSLGVSVSYFDVKVNNITSLADKTLYVECEVLKEKTVLSYQSTYEIKIKGQKGVFSSFQSELTVPSDVTLTEGDIFSGELTFHNFEDDIDGYPEKRYKQSKGLLLACESENINIIGRSHSPYSFFRKINRYLCSVVTDTLSDDVSPFVRCVLLGDRNGISETVKRDFENLGISHMLAISGMHLSIIIAFLYFFLTALCIDKKIKNFVLVFFCIFIMAVTGLSVSVVRAGLMVIVGYICFYCKKTPDPVSSLCFACALICLVSPYSIYDAGLMLSFCAAFAIVTLGEKIRADIYESKLPKRLKRPLVALLVSLAASYAVLPPSYFYFGRISYMSPVFTLLLSPVIVLILYLSVILLITAKIPFISFIIIKALDTAVRALLLAVSFFSDLHTYIISLDYPFAVYIILLFIIICLVLFIFCPKRSAWYFIPVVFFMISYPICSTVYNGQIKNEMYVSVCNRGVNDVISCTKEGECALIDVGDGSFSYLYSAYRKTMKSDCVTGFSSYIAVNYYNRSAASLGKLLSNEFVETVYLPEPSEEDIGLYEEMYERAEESGVQAVTYEYGEEIALGAISVTVREPVYIKRSKRPIHEIHVNGGEKDVVYLGGAYSETADPPEGATLICGTFGPKYKNKFSSENQEVYLCKDASEYYTGKSYREYDGYLRIIIKNDN